jgi:hypothetical protein
MVPVSCGLERERVHIWNITNHQLVSIQITVENTYLVREFHKTMKKINQAEDGKPHSFVSLNTKLFQTKSNNLSEGYGIHVLFNALLSRFGAAE